MKLEFSAKGLTAYLEKMSERTRLVSGWLNRVAYPRLIKVQRQRWQTEGASEGKQWQPLTSLKYKQSKLKKFADYPGGGRKLLIATNRLVDSMTGDNKKEHWKLVDPLRSRLEMGSTVPYSGYVDEKRSLTSLSRQTVDGLVRDLTDYIVRGTMRNV